jgi:O-antigen chain-terminating methyltransferase
MTESLEARLRRLEEEREEADRRYNDALTALDRALPAAVAVPQPAPGVDDHQLGALNTSWQTIAGPPGGPGLKGRLAGFIWRTVAPYLERQLSFNSTLVDHLNRQSAAAREAHRTAIAQADAIRTALAAQVEYNSRLIVYLQQVTAYVDTKDRSTEGSALVVNAAVSGLADSTDRRWESLSTRVESRVHAVEAGQQSLRTLVGIAQQATAAMKRELERLAAPAADASGGGSDGQTTGTPSTRDAFAPALDAYKYVGFEDRFRGSREAIRERFQSYVGYFESRGEVLDVGCGRGEFLELLRAANIAGRGIDLNHEMAELCRSRGLDVTEADAVGYLSALPDASLGGIFAAQVVEHLQPGYLLRFLELACQKVRPGGRVVLETLNPACWVAFFDSYIRDITHVWPLHPDTLQYLALASGFTRAEIEFRSPVPEHQRLQHVPGDQSDAVVRELCATFNENVDRLNARLYTHLDYAIVAEVADS